MKIFIYSDYLIFIMEETVFHKIVNGEVPCHKVWEDENYLAFLSIFPNTEGVTVVIPKVFSPSYFVECSDEVMFGLIKTAKKVAKLLDNTFDDVGRTAMVLEGFGVNYLHAKLFPMHGTILASWKPMKSDIDTYSENYPGYISSHDSVRESDEKLAKTAQLIRDKNNL